jgi:hypothetical protein
MNTQRETVFKRCGCTGPVSGRQLAARSQQLPESGHGSWYYAVQVTTVGGRRAPARSSGTDRLSQSAVRCTMVRRQPARSRLAVQPRSLSSPDE